MCHGVNIPTPDAATCVKSTDFTMTLEPDPVLWSDEESAVMVAARCQALEVVVDMDAFPVQTDFKTCEYVASNFSLDDIFVT